MLHYTRFVQIGRMVFISHGSHKRKLAVTAEISEQNLVLIDEPCSGVHHRPINMKMLHLTSIVMKVWYSWQPEYLEPGLGRRN